MQLGCEQINISIDGRKLTLRPSLRAGLNLARKYENFANVVRDIQNGSLTTMLDVLQTCSTDDHEQIDLHSISDSEKSIAHILLTLKQPLLNLVLMFVSSDEKEAPKDQAQSTEPPVAFSDHFEELFQIGTGMIGWSPDDTWSATPKEIICAHNGRVKLLQMIFGGGDASKQISENSNLSLDQKARFAFEKIGIRRE